MSIPRNHDLVVVTKSREHSHRSPKKAIPLEPCTVSWVLMSDNFKHGPRAAYTKNTGFGVSSGFDPQLCYLLDDGSVI